MSFYFIDSDEINWESPTFIKADFPELSLNSIEAVYAPPIKRKRYVQSKISIDYPNKVIGNRKEIEKWAQRVLINNSLNRIERDSSQYYRPEIISLKYVETWKWQHHFKVLVLDEDECLLEYNL